MAAGLLLRRAAGMKDGGAFGGRKGGQFQFLERARRHGGNLRPMLDGLRRHAASQADFLVGGIILELEREQFEREGGELLIADCQLPIGNQRTQLGGEIKKFFVHAVFVRGWFSATAKSRIAENCFPSQARRKRSADSLSASCQAWRRNTRTGCPRSTVFHAQRFLNCAARVCHHG